ncbi:hypothetical protein [Microtetraspora malaysiensis]|uniref:hypothetical protein n=1 Tax=Microtetraspora malaysiensis TaxID=161358 RepID=UPI00082C6BA1|nr:hypothetical protein [Microtetraspora malaysiensis]
MTRSSEQRGEGNDREPVKGAESARRCGPGSPQPEPEPAPDRSDSAPGSEGARTARGASRRAERPSKHEIYPGGTIETALTPSGEPSMVASQLLWDGSSATSRVDQAIAEAISERADEADEADDDARPDADRP